MDNTTLIWLIPSFFLVAILYSSVGHGGASGYLAILLFVPGGLMPSSMATTALTLNLLVASLGLIAFVRAGHFSARLTWPFIIASIPAAYLGGLTPVSVKVYGILLAVSLTVAATRLFMRMKDKQGASYSMPRLALSIPTGAGIGWLSGVVGVGGGIFLSPLLLLMRWANPKQTAASSACFILVNSAAGLMGRFTRGAIEYGNLWPLLIAAFAGGLIGSRMGAKRLSAEMLKKLLAVVLLLASLKLIKMVMV